MAVGRDDAVRRDVRAVGQPGLQADRELRAAAAGMHGAAVVDAPGRGVEDAHRAEVALDGLAEAQHDLRGLRRAASRRAAARCRRASRAPTRRRARSEQRATQQARRRARARAASHQASALRLSGAAAPPRGAPPAHDHDARAAEQHEQPSRRTRRRARRRSSRARTARR